MRTLQALAAVAAVSLTASLASAAGILVNPSFESGGSGNPSDNAAIKGWRHSTWSGTTSSARTGKDGNNVYFQWYNATVETSPALRPNAKPGQQFNLSFLWGVESGTTLWDDSYAHIDFYDAAGVLAGTHQVTLSRGPANSTMQAYNTTATAPAGTASVGVRMRTRNGTGNALNFDNAVLTRVTPTGAVKYGFGAAGAANMSPTINDAGFSAGSLTAGAGVSASNSDFATNLTSGGTDRPGLSIASSSTASSIADSVLGDDYVQFEVAPAAGYEMDLTSVSFDSLLQAAASGNFTGTIQVRSSLDGFASSLGEVSRTFNAAYADAVTPWYWDSLALDASFENLTAPVQFRLYVADSSDAATSAVLMDNISVVGTVTVVPEPVTASVLAIASTLLLGRRRRA